MIKIWPWHSVSVGPGLPDFNSQKDLIGLVIMGLAAVFVVVSMRLAKKQ